MGSMDRLNNEIDELNIELQEANEKIATLQIENKLLRDLVTCLKSKL